MRGRVGEGGPRVGLRVVDHEGVGGGERMLGFRVVGHEGVGGEGGGGGTNLDVQLVLGEGQGLSRRHPELPFHQVLSSYGLTDRMLHLQGTKSQHVS